LLSGGALQVCGLGDLGAVDGEHEVTALEAEALRRRAIGNVDDDDALRRGIERSESARAGERLETLAPWNGDGVSISFSSCGVSGKASSATATASSLPARIRPSFALPPIALVAKR